MLTEDRIDRTGKRNHGGQRKYSDEQYALAELMLTHGFTIEATARVTRISVDMIMKLSSGAVMFEIDVGMNGRFYEDEK